MHNINTLYYIVNTLSIYKWDYFYTITDPSMCYDELVGGGRGWVSKVSGP